MDIIIMEYGIQRVTSYILQSHFLWTTVGFFFFFDEQDFKETVESKLW